MRICSSVFSFTASRLAVVFVVVVAVDVFAFSEDNVLNDNLFAAPESSGEWTTDIDHGGAGLFTLSSDNNGVLMDDMDLSSAFLPTTGEDRIASYPASGCSTFGGIETRDEDPSCPVFPLKKEDLTLPTLEDLQNAIKIPDIETETSPLSPMKVAPFKEKDPNCPRKYPHHLCCICDGFFAFELCQDCVGFIPSCFAYHLEVCCQTYGRRWEPGSGDNLDNWLSGGLYNPSLNSYGGVLAEFCLVM